MPCAGIKAKSGDSITTIPCQFSFVFQKEELMDVDNKQWCPFHAPLEDEDGNLTKKGNWNDVEIKRFYAEISTLREKALQQQGKLDLRGVVFPGEANFRAREFPNVDFFHSEFKEHVSFWRAEFKENAIFSFAQFKGQASFSNARFNGDFTSFQNAKFEENTDFETVIFSGGEVHFDNVKFKKTVHFEHSIFSSKITYFHNTEFCGIETNFKKVQFERAALFSNAHFRSEYILFQNSRFKRYTSFRYPGNNTDADAFHGEVHFEGAEFLGEVNFENRKFQQATSFRDCIFHKAPRFHKCRLHQDTDFTDAKFLDTKDDEAARAYRTLKLDMEEKRARQEQLRFYALEMKSRRSEEKRKFLKFISWLYEATSDYGQRIFLPLAWLVYSFLVFAFFYAAYFKGLTDLDVARILPRSLHFSIKQIVRPFGVFASSSLYEFFGKTPSANLMALPLIIAATLQSFLSLALLLLSGLAARWRFKIG